MPDKMLDRNGVDVVVGARVYVLPQPGLRKGGPAWVRAIEKFPPDKRGLRARCDNAPQHETINEHNHTFSSWCKPNELEVLNA